MITPALITYVKDQLAKGKTKEQIRAELLQGGGWKYSDIEEVFVSLTSVSVQKSHKGISGFLMLVVVLVLLAGGGVYAMKRFNIHSYGELKTFIVGPSSTAEVPQTQVAEDSVPTAVSTNSYDPVIEKRIATELIMMRYAKKALVYEKGSAARFCTSAEFIKSKNEATAEITAHGFALQLSDYHCFETDTAFAVSLPLPRGGYYCVDMVFTGVVDGELKSAVCGSPSVTYMITPSKDIDEILALEQEGSTPQNLSKTNSAVVQSFQDKDTGKAVSIGAEAEAWFDPRGSYAGACASIQKAVPGVVCFDSATQWAASFTLFDASGGGYACTDKAHVLGSIKISKPVTTTVCPKQ